MYKGLTSSPAKLSIRARKIGEVICTRREIASLRSCNVSYPSVFLAILRARVSGCVAVLVCATHAWATAISFTIMHVPSTEISRSNDHSPLQRCSHYLRLYTFAREITLWREKLVRKRMTFPSRSIPKNWTEIEQSGSPNVTFEYFLISDYFPFYTLNAARHVEENWT